jgi:hypothetical protein
VSDSEEKSTRDRLRKYTPGELVGKVPWSEIRKQMITSLGVAFGALIGFIWTSVVQQAFVVAGIITPLGITSWGNWFGYVIGAILVTFFSVIMLIVLARGQAKTQQK